MKTHYKLKDGKWHVFEDKAELTPILIVPGSLWAAGVEWKKWVYLQTILSKPYPPGVTMEVRAA